MVKQIKSSMKKKTNTSEDPFPIFLKMFLFYTVVDWEDHTLAGNKKLLLWKSQQPSRVHSDSKPWEGFCIFLKDLILPV